MDIIRRIRATREGEWVTDHRNYVSLYLGVLQYVSDIAKTASVGKLAWLGFAWLDDGCRKPAQDNINCFGAKTQPRALLPPTLNKLLGAIKVNSMP